MEALKAFMEKCPTGFKAKSTDSKAWLVGNPEGVLNLS